MRTSTINNRGPIYVDEIIQGCVEAVALKVLPQLTAHDPKIQSIKFMFGHPQECAQRLMEMSQGPIAKKSKFPIVMLFADIINSPSSIRVGYPDVTLNIVIANSTDATYKVDKRQEKNFKPILRPIYDALIREIARCGYFWVQSERQIWGREIERYFWGREGIQGNTANNSSVDFIDAIEIKNLKLTMSRRTATQPNTFMQLVEILLGEIRAEITVDAVTDNTIYHPFFKKKITEITTETQDYIEGESFTQELDGDGIPTGNIIGISINFYVGQVMIAKR